jgi:hypothetical protein
MFLPEVLPTDVKKLVVLTKREFDELGEYSCSLPTGTTVGRRWKRDMNAYRQPTCFFLHVCDGRPEPSFRGEDWWMGEYAADPKAKIRDDGTPETVRILWSKIVLSEEAGSRQRPGRSP